jgi:hypothetical protein
VALTRRSAAMMSSNRRILSGAAASQAVRGRPSDVIAPLVLLGLALSKRGGSGLLTREKVSKRSNRADMGWQDNVWIGLSADHISPVLSERIYSPDGANAVGSSAEWGNGWWR